MATSPLRWGRIALGGFLAEALLVVLVIPVRMLTTGESGVTFVAVAGSFAVFVPIAWTLCRSLQRPVLHGVLMGAFAAAIYLTLQLAGSLFVANAPPVPAIYYVAHLLKLAGGASGGWLGERTTARAGSHSLRA